MRQAIQNDRASTAAANATSMAIVQNLGNDPNITPMFANPDYTNPNTVFVNAPPNGPSYPIYVDPLGYYTWAPPYSQWVGGQINNGGIARASPQYVNSRTTGLRWFALLDDIYFDNDINNMGIPKQIGAGIFDRDNLFTWAYLLQRPTQSNASIVNLTIIIYNSRPIQMINSLVPDEGVFGADANSTVTYDTNTNLVTVQWNPANVPGPAVRVGSWILDATPQSPAPGSYTQPHAAFYRVVGVVEGVNGGQPTLTLEMQTALRSFPANAQTNGVLIVMENVAEVVDKRGGWHP
jgi:hypothetical protein